MALRRHNKATLLVVNVPAANKVRNTPGSKKARCELFCSLPTSALVLPPWLPVADVCCRAWIAFASISRPARRIESGMPWLDGQSAVYIKAQLKAFATGARRNDISQQMRNIARQMTAAEIDEAAHYYAGRP
jgi:hypothetical protein